MKTTENIEQILETLTILKQEGEVSELRILNTGKGTLSGYFDDLEKLAYMAAEHDGKAPAIYTTLNPVKQDLLARANNRIITRAKQTTSDADIAYRAWFPVDFDPVRASGISSTDEEHEAAFAKAEEVREWLTEEGWPEPIVADSGNGAHLLYSIDLPNDDASRELVKAAMEALDFRFSDDQVNVDTSTFNAARIWKLYGTMSCKGDHTQDRPHRLSHIKDYPNELKEVSVEQLQSLADTYQKVKQPVHSSTNKTESENGFELEVFLKEHGLEVASKGTWQKGATKYVLEQCPWNESHMNKSAYIIQFANGALAAGCHHNSCSEESWQTLREKLDPEWKGKEAKEETKKESQADILIRLGSEAAFFQDELGEACAVIAINDHKELWKVKSKKFKMWLTKRFYEETGKAPSSDAMNQAVSVMEMKSTFEGEEHRLNLRVAEKEGAFYYDLADETWSVVKIEPNNCTVLKDPPILFTRNKNTKKQVYPDFSGDLKLLLNHVRIKDEDNQILYLVYLVSCLIPNIPHTVLVFSGEKGASKSTSMRMTRQVVDPAVRDLLTMPNSIQDLALSLANNYMPSFDNLDGLSAEKSDLLCIASTGGGFSKRTLFTDEDETLLDIRRCVGLTGINVVVTRPDLIDRSVMIELDRIPEEERREESKVWKSFEEEKPLIIGGALQTLAKAMELYPKIKLDKLPRMADFTRWGYAIAEALEYGGERFLQAYSNNRNQSNDEAISSHPVAAAVVALMKDTSSWSGSVASLLDALERAAQHEKINTNVKVFPKAAHILSRRLREVKSNLEEVGITFEIRHSGDYKKVFIKKNSLNIVQSSMDPESHHPKKYSASALDQSDTFQNKIKRSLGDTLDLTDEELFE